MERKERKRSEGNEREGGEEARKVTGGNGKLEEGAEVRGFNQVIPHHNFLDPPLSPLS